MHCSPSQQPVRLGKNWRLRHQEEKEKLPESLVDTGADEKNRTSDLLITKQLHYQLSYISAGLIIAFPGFS